MSQDQLEQAAKTVKAFMEREGAVRTSKDQIGGFVTVRDICEKNDIYCGNWHQLKAYMLKRGIRLCYIQGKGHYLGYHGEEITNTLSLYKMARGWQRHLHTSEQALRSANKDSWEWILSRDGNFAIESEV